MFYEFAVAPDLVALWCNRDGYNGFLKQFGIDKKRIVSRFPKKWEVSVEDAFRRLHPNPTHLQTARKTEIIAILKRRMVKRGSKNYVHDVSWLENAENEHLERPFKGIVADANPRNVPSVTVITCADEILARLEEFPGSCDAARTPDALVAPIAPILRCCEFSIFVDPYFDTSLRFLEPFQLRLQVLMNERYGSAAPKVELHTSIERHFKPSDPRNPSLEATEATRMMNSFQSRLPRVIPRGLSVKVVIWKERQRGQKLHNRYLLTDIGSVSFGTGLDCNDEAFHRDQPQGQSDDIFCLSEESHLKRWDEYFFAPAFDKVTEAAITGSHVQ
jgi:hypothetical protein